MRESRRKANGAFQTRITLEIGVLALVTVFLGMFGRTVKISAADNTTVTIGEVTVAGTVGTELTPQTLELTVENGKFDTAQFYVGKDLSDYFLKMISNNDGLSEAQTFGRKFFDSSADNYGKYVYAYVKPLGVKIIIKETSETKVVCEVSGTPFTPSKNTAMHATFDITMFEDASGSTVSVVNTDAKWNIEATDVKQYYGGAGVKVSGIEDGKIPGQAGTAIDLTFDIELYKAVFAHDIPAGTDLSTWYAGDTGSGASLTNQLPVGMSVTLVDDIKAGDMSCELRLSGTPKYSCSNVFYPKVPAEYIVGACKSGSTENANPYWLNGNLTKTSSSQSPLFRITAVLETQEPFIVFNNNDIMIYAEENYEAPTSIDNVFKTVKSLRAYMVIYNSTKQHVFPRDPYQEANTTWDGEDGYLYSNTKGNLNTDAMGFLYSPCADEEHFTVTDLYSRGDWSLSRAGYYLSFYGKAYNVGEYPLTYFIPKTFLYDREGEEGYTEIAESKGKLIVMKPFQLEIDDTELEIKVGKAIPENTYITVKTSVYSKKDLKSGLTPETLEYKVSDSFKAIGLDLEPVAVTTKSVVFKVTGTLDAKGERYNLEECVTLSYKNFVQGNYTNAERFGEIEINANPDSVIRIIGGNYGQAGQEIDYTPRADVKIYAKISGTSTVTGGAINMTQGRLETDVKYACYSTDGGKKWKKGTLTDKQFEKLLIKGMTFCISESYDKKAKGPAEGAIIYVFPETKAQPKAPKFKIDFTTFADATGETTGQFTLMLVDGSEAVTLDPSKIRSDYEIGIVSGKDVNSDGYGVWPVSGGLTIAGLAGTKTQKTTYFIKTQATADTPSGKVVKLTVSGIQKAPNVKIDYKKEILKGKENMSMTVSDVLKVNKMSKEDAKTAIDISSYLQTGVQTEFKIWLAATEKKPASAIQTIPAAARAVAATSGAITFNSGKHSVTLGKAYEVFDPDKDKWGGIPKITSAGTYTFRIRRKADAKGGKETDSYTAYAAGEEMKLVVEYGEYTSGKSTKNGVLSAEVTIR